MAASTRTSTGPLAAAAHPADLPLLQHAQQLYLQGQGELADLVQKERAAVRLLEQPLARPVRAR